MQFADSIFEVKSLGDSGAIEGLLAGFGDIDRGGDRLVAGCLTRTLAERRGPLAMLFAHDHKRPIGAWREFNERPEGLYAKGKITLECRDGKEAHALCRDGGLSALSIGWSPVRVASGKDGERVVLEAELFEASLVPVGMHDRARVIAVKDYDGPRAYAELLAEVTGLSGHKARKFAGAGWKAINSPDEAEALAEVERLFDEHSARLAALGGR